LDFPHKGGTGSTGAARGWRRPGAAVARPAGVPDGCNSASPGAPQGIPARAAANDDVGGRAVPCDCGDVLVGSRPLGVDDGAVSSWRSQRSRSSWARAARRWPRAPRRRRASPPWPRVDRPSRVG